VRQRNPLAIVGIEGFYLQSRPVRLGKKRNCAWRDCSIHIHQQNLNLLCALSYRW
jgi:hypothetical protein